MQSKVTIPALKALCDQATISVLEARRSSAVVLVREEKKLNAMRNNMAKEGKSTERVATSIEFMPQVISGLTLLSTA